MNDEISGFVYTPSADPLSDALLDLRPVGVTYGYCRFSAPWAVSMKHEKCARLHLVLHGHAYLGVQGGPWVKLQPGDIALLPRGDRHVLSADRTTAPVELTELPRQQLGDRTYTLGVGGGGEPALMVCCGVEFRQPALHAVLALMPPALVVRGTTVDDPVLMQLVSAMSAEVGGDRVGGASVLARFADALITLIVRRWVEQARGEEIGWLAGIREPKVARLLSAMNLDPGGRWTITRMTKTAGVSRSVLYEKFIAVMGISPAEYLTRLCMRLACSWLASGTLTVSQAAERLGYDSAPGFSRAFKRVVGVAPATYRQTESGHRKYRES